MIQPDNILSGFIPVCVSGWKDFKLIDSGNFEKLEQFGENILWRPEPQACWEKSLPESEWSDKAHARFLKFSADINSSDKGKWDILKPMKQQWFINYKYKDLLLKFRLGLTAFKHVGIFPEQSDNWNFIIDTISEINSPDTTILNLFAYTGGASLAARAAGAQVVHVDSVKQVIDWTNENMKASNMDGIRWIVDDAVKFVNREKRRGKKYSGIILDPPAYGRGPDGEKWILEEGITDLVKSCSELLQPEKSFLVLNLYSMGFSALVADNLISQQIKSIKFRQFGEFYFNDISDKKLPLGTYFRMKTF